METISRKRVLNTQCTDQLRIVGPWQEHQLWGIIGDSWLGGGTLLSKCVFS